MHTSAYPALAAQLQSLALKLAARSPAKSVPLLYPRTTLHSGGMSLGNIYDEVFLDRCYESPKPLPARPKVIDAGAHLGLASLFFLQRYPDCHITALEPNPNLTPLLQRNLAPWSRQVVILEAALSTRAGTATFAVTEENLFNVTAGLVQRGTGDLRTYDVSCIDAAELLREPVDLMKLDVEGHEYELLRLEQFRPDHVSNLVAEFHDVEGEGRDVFLDVMRLLLDVRGYRCANLWNVQVGREALEKMSGCVMLKLF